MTLGLSPSTHCSPNANYCNLTPYSQCILSSGSCSLMIEGLSAGNVNVSAYFSGDADNQNSSGEFPILITEASTQTSVSCAPQSVIVGSPTRCQAVISGYYQTGNIGHYPMGNITFASSSPTGYFTPANQCIIWSNSSGTCHVDYYDTGLGSPQIEVFYGGDTNNAGSKGSTSVTVFWSSEYIWVVHGGFSID